MDSNLILPPGIQPFEPSRDVHRGDRGMIVNDTGLPDVLVEGAVATYFEEHASLAWGRESTFQTYANQGSLLARSEFRVPNSIIEEIRLARDMAERDDDIASAMGWCVAAAFDSMPQHFHQDDRTVALFDSMAEDMDLSGAMKELYREYLISGQVNSIHLFTRKMLEYQPFAAKEIKEETLATPLLGVLPAENIRVLGNDIFGTGTLAYDPDSPALRTWLEEYFSDSINPARKAALGRQDRISANLFTDYVDIDPMAYYDEELYTCYSSRLYLLNPRMVSRVTMPKGSWKYPRPPLTRNFALLEAKRLLNIMDYALLQGGSNFIVVAKKGSDARPALPEEVANLRDVVKRASKTGVIVGDHRLDFDIITPDLAELLSPTKRRLIGRKLAMALLRTPEHGTEEPQGEGMKAEMEMMARVITADRNDLTQHVKTAVYNEVRRRNKDLFTKGAPMIFFPKVILQSDQFFTDFVLKLRDRGDIPRAWAVEAAGYPFPAAIEQRTREVDANVDEKMAPAAVPFSSPDMGPQDNNTGRPPGAQDGRPSQDPARGTQRIQRVPGETVRAVYDDALEQVVRCGELTYAILEEYDGGEPGRVKSIEREAIDGGQALRQGPLAMVPVNREVDSAEDKAVNLAEGLRMIVGQRRGDRAFFAKLLVFREPEFSTADAETRVARWGFPVTMVEEPDDPATREPADA